MLNVYTYNNDNNINLIIDLLFSLSVLENLLLTTQRLLRSDAHYFLMHELHYAAAKRLTVDVSALTNARS